MWPAVVLAGHAVEDLAIADSDRPTLADVRQRTTYGIRPARGVNRDHRRRCGRGQRCPARLRELKHELEARAAAAAVYLLDPSAPARDRKAPVMPAPTTSEGRQSRPVRRVPQRRGPSRCCIRGCRPVGHPRSERHYHDRYSKEVHRSNDIPRSAGVIGERWPSRGLTLALLTAADRGRRYPRPNLAEGALVHARRCPAAAPASPHNRTTSVSAAGRLRGNASTTPVVHTSACPCDQTTQEAWRRPNLGATATTDPTTIIATGMGHHQCS